MRTQLFCSPLLLLSLAVPVAAGGPSADLRKLTLDEVVELGLAQNADIAVERLVRKGAALALEEAERTYEPYLTGAVERSSLDEPALDDPSTAGTIGSTTDSWEVGLAQPIPTGGNVRLDFDYTRIDTTSSEVVVNPEYGASFTLSVAQPLLRGRRIDERRRRIRVARKDRDISEAEFRATIADVVAAVKQRYFHLVFAVEYRETQTRLVSLVRTLQADNRERVRAGVLPRYNLLLGDAELAAREKDLIVAETNVARAEDALKGLILAPQDRDGWEQGLDPVDRPPVEPVEVDEASVMTRALSRRAELVSAQLAVERADVLRQYTRDRTRPALDLVASYGSLGVSGNVLVRDAGTGSVLDELPGGPGDALSDALGWRHPSWSVGFRLAYPILNRQARVADARALVARDEFAARREQLELAVIAEVRDAVRSVRANYARAERAREARELQEQRLEAEMQLLGAGTTSAFFVIQAQRDLALSELAHLAAVADYHTSLVRLERVDESVVAPSESGS